MQSDVLSIVPAGLDGWKLHEDPSSSLDNGLERYRYARTAGVEGESVTSEGSKDGATSSYLLRGQDENHTTSMPSTLVFPSARR